MYTLRRVLPLLGGGNALPSFAQIEAAVSRAVELAWFDGLRTGAFAGFLAGLIAGIVVAALLRQGASS